ncbi:hypothetical protein [Novipirellula sp.]|uniref:hypothetical protein n=1 Tax=Novipirellula sp. TaxID=2795430 RepID=UPI003561C09A
MKVFTVLTLTISLFGLVGCKQEAAPTPAPPAETADDHGHDHADGEVRDHSVAGHGHGAGPHDGVIADWGGGKYHVEFTVDHDKTEATVYVLGGDEKTPAPIDAESIELSIVDPQMVVTLAAAPQDDDPEGKASRFIGTHEKLGVVQEYEGTMTGVIDGTPYSGDFKEEAHDH